MDGGSAVQARLSGAPSSAQGMDAAGSSARSNTSALPAIQLPKGGGAVRGMGAKFAANPVTGTGSMSVPIATSPSRSGFGPPHECNRTTQSRSVQRYLKRMLYGNHAPYFPELKSDAAWPELPGADASDDSGAWHVDVVFDYGEHDASAPTPNDAGSWPVRSDLYSSYRAGFVLSACETGLGRLDRGGNPLGFASTLLACGAAALATTRWPVRTTPPRPFSPPFMHGVRQVTRFVPHGAPH